MPKQAQEELHKHLFSLVVTIFSRVVTGHDVLHEFERLLRDEMALDRSVNFTGSFVTLGNVLGHKPKNRLSHWLERGLRDYSPKRLKMWDADASPRIGLAAKLKSGRLAPGIGEPPKSLVDHDQIKQNEIRTVSLIREALWEKAKWIGAAYVAEEGHSVPPVLALIFQDQEAAKQIFHFWNRELGDSDSAERLRVSIVRGINKDKPFSYRVVLGSDPSRELRRPEIKYGVFISRMQTMEPNSAASVELFLSSYRKTKSYFLAAAVAKGERFTSSFVPEPVDSPHLLKHDLYVRDAWEIGRHDPDSMGVFTDDVPIIPEGQTRPPVLELLQWKKSIPMREFARSLE